MVEHLAARGAQEPTLYLAQVAALWADHTQAMLTLRSIFLFLDRTYVVPHAAARSLFDLGLQLLRSHLDQHPQVPGSHSRARQQLLPDHRMGCAPVSTRLRVCYTAVCSSLSSTQGPDHRWLGQHQPSQCPSAQARRLPLPRPQLLCACTRHPRHWMQRQSSVTGSPSEPASAFQTLPSTAAGQEPMASQVLRFLPCLKQLLLPGSSGQPGLQVGRKTVGGLLGLIESERRDTAVDRSLAASLLRMLGSLNLYGEDFEPPFLRDTDLFYDAEGSRSMSTMEVPEYLQHCEVWLPPAPAALMSAGGGTGWGLFLV